MGALCERESGEKVLLVNTTTFSNMFFNKMLSNMLQGHKIQ